MAKTFFIEKDYVVATIMYFKEKHFGEKFVTLKELNYVTSEMQKVFNKKGINACITSSIGCDHFNTAGSVILKKVTIFFIEKFYKAYAPLDILKVVWDHKFIAEKLYELKKEELEALEKLKTN